MAKPSKSGRKPPKRFGVKVNTFYVAPVVREAFNKLIAKQKWGGTQGRVLEDAMIRLLDAEGFWNDEEKRRYADENANRPPPGRRPTKGT